MLYNRFIYLMVHFSSKGRTVDNFDREQPKEKWKRRREKQIRSIIGTRSKND